MSVNTGGTQQTLIEILEARIADLEEDDELHCIVYARSVKRIAELEGTCKEWSDTNRIHAATISDMEARIAELEKAEKVEKLFTASKLKLISVQQEKIDLLKEQNKILEGKLRTIQQDERDISLKPLISNRPTSSRGVIKMRFTKTQKTAISASAVCMLVTLYGAMVGILSFYLMECI